MGELYARTGAGVWLQLQRQLPGNWLLLVGFAMYYLRDRLPGRWGVLVAVGLPTLVVIRATADPIVTRCFEPLALGILVHLRGHRHSPLGNFARLGDFSYGIYIIHFSSGAGAGRQRVCSPAIRGRILVLACAGCGPVGAEFARDRASRFSGALPLPLGGKGVGGTT